MSLSVAASVIEEVAQGRRPDIVQLIQAATTLHDLFLAAAPPYRALSEGDLSNAMGLVHHVLHGAVPRLSEAGRARTLRLAAAVRHLSVTPTLGHLPLAARPRLTGARAGSA